MQIHYIMNKPFTSLAAAACLLAACSPNKGPKNDGPVKLNDPADFKKEYHAEQIGSGISFTAESNWTASVSTATKAAADEPWIDIEPKSGGAGANTLQIALQPNLTGKDREAEIDIHCLSSKTTFVVKQTATTTDGEVQGVYFQINNDGKWSLTVAEEDRFPHALAVKSVGSGALLTADMLRQIGTDQLEMLDMSQAVYETAGFPVDFLGSPLDYPGGPAAWDKAQLQLPALTSVFLPLNVSRIGTMGFSGSRLRSIDLSSNIGAIGYAAFRFCKELDKVEFPSSLERIEECAFQETGLKEVELPGSVVSVGAYAFMNSAVTSFIAKHSSDTLCIEPMAFSGCQYLRTIDVGQREVHILAEAFEMCIDLREVVLENATMIGGRAFQQCNLLASVKLGNTDSVGNYAFAACRNLSSVALGETLTALGDGVFSGCSALGAIELPPSLETIGSLAFAGCNLTGIVLPEKVREIGSDPFDLCVNLRNIEFKTERLSRIPSGFIRGNEACYTITLPESVEQIGANAFWGCAKLGWIQLGSRVNFIGKDALSNCPVLRAIICYAETPPDCADDMVFSSSGYATTSKPNQCHVPAASLDAYTADPNWSQLKAHQFFDFFGMDPAAE